jgi:drug/metabolite transporter (DMT)-like permease
MVALSWVAAFVACLGYGVGSILQSIGARRTANVAGVSGAAMILVQLPFLLGVLCDVAGFAGNVVALQNLPLFLVQSIITASVGVTAVIASVRGERLGWIMWVALVVLGVGLVLLCLTASADTAVRISPTAQGLICGSAVLPVLVGLVGLRLRSPASSIALAAAAGLGFTGVAVASRAISAETLSRSLLAEPLAWAIVLHGVIGGVCFALALRRGSVTSVTAVTFAAELVIPSALGLWLFDDHVAPGDGPWALLGFILAIGGTISLSRHVPEHA